MISRQAVKAAAAELDQGVGGRGVKIPSEAVEAAAKSLRDVYFPGNTNSPVPIKWEDVARGVLEAAGPHILPPREEVEGAVGEVLWNVMTHPVPHVVLGRDVSRMVGLVTDVVMSLLEEGV